MPVSTECAAALLSFRYPSNILFSYYKDYIYKAQFEYSSNKELPRPVLVGFGYQYYVEEYDPIQLKILTRLCKKFRR